MPRKPLHEPWTIETDEALRNLWAKPLTLSAIARRMKRATATVQLKATATVQLKATALGLPKREMGAKLPGSAASPQLPGALNAPK